MIIFLDLDGVIINWVRHVCTWYNIPYKPEKITHWNIMPELAKVSEKAFWEGIKKAAFWESLKFYPGAKTFIEKLKQLGTVILLSSPVWGCAGYRQNWIQYNLPNFFEKKQYILTPAKWACAHDKTILIDDSDENCTSFRRNGGYSILYPQPWNAGSITTGIDLYYENKNNLVIDTIRDIINKGKRNELKGVYHGNV